MVMYAGKFSARMTRRWTQKSWIRRRQMGRMASFVFSSSASAENAFASSAEEIENLKKEAEAFREMRKELRGDHGPHRLFQKVSYAACTHASLTTHCRSSTRTSTGYLPWRICGKFPDVFVPCLLITGAS